MSDGRDVARAIDALRRGWAVAIDECEFLAVETATADSLAEFDSPHPADIVISGSRATTLKLVNQRNAVPTQSVRIERTAWIDLDEATAIVDPALDLAHPLKGPFRTLALDAPDALAAAIRLTRLAGLLPGLFIRTAFDRTAIPATSILGREESLDLRVASRARMPGKYGENAEIVAFRSVSDAAEHVALLIGSPTGVPPLVRIHSECLTGDALGSLKCDCGAQLAEALSAIGAAGWGILIYLRQEGRGIGLVNKLRAYALQDQGFDTVDANLRLGFGDDERSFAVAARMLRLLAQNRVRLLTNNPRKTAALEAAGIAVAEQVPLRIAPNPHNRAYLDAKRLRSGHQL